MKIKYIFLILTIMIHQAIAGDKESQSLAQSDEGKRMFDVVTEMSSTNNIRDLVKTLPKIDKLWNSDPSGYLQAMDISIHALFASPDPQASNAADAAASKVLEKKRPADNETAANYFVIKKNIVKQIERRAKPSDNKRVMILMADLLSEVRLQRIPNFHSEVIQHPGRKVLEDAGVRRPEDLPTAIQKKAVADAVKRNEDNQKLQSLQQVLSSMDTALTHALIEKAHRLPMQGIQKQEFVRELADRAKLTVEERDRLKSSE